MKIITGVFFSKNEPNLPAITLTGDSFILDRKRQPKNMFSGIIIPREQEKPPSELDGFVSDYRPDEIFGYIFDSYGFARMFDYLETERKVVFTKIYEGRPDEIYYSFTLREGNEWLGTWTMKQGSEEIDSGYASCVIVPVSDQMFDVSRFMNDNIRNRLSF